MRGRLWLTVGVAAGVATVAAFAVLDAARRDPARESSAAGAGEATAPRISGPDVPPGGGLPGRLVFLVGPECRVRVLDLATLTLGPEGPATSCRLWASPRGDLVAFERASDEGPTVWLASTGSPPTRRNTVGPVASPPAWGPDGDRLALCRPGGSTVVVALDGEELDRVDGCHPRFAPDGRVVTWVRAIEESSTGNGHVIGRAPAPDGTVAVATARPSRGYGFDLTLELWSDGELRRSVPLPQYGPNPGFFGMEISFAPGGNEVALTTPAVLTPRGPEDLIALLDLRSGLPVEGLADRRFAGLAWSPDGAWLAFSTGDEVLVYGPARADPVYVLPLRARALGWLRAQPRPGTGPLPRRRGVRPPPRRRRAAAGSRT